MWSGAVLANPVAILARSLVSPMPTAQVRPVRSCTVVTDCSSELLRVVAAGAEERFIPAPHLDRVSEAPQHLHHFGRCSVVGRMITWQEHRVRALAERSLHRHPRVHPVRPRLVRGCGDDLSRPVRVTVASHHHGTPAQLGSPPDLHRRQEGIHVDVQQPPGQISSRRGHRSSVPDWWRTPAKNVGLGRRSARPVAGVAESAVPAEG